MAEELYDALVEGRERPEDVTFRQTKRPLLVEEVLAVLSEVFEVEPAAFSGGAAIRRYAGGGGHHVDSPWGVVAARSGTGVGDGHRCGGEPAVAPVGGTDGGGLGFAKADPASRSQARGPAQGGGWPLSIKSRADPRPPFTTIDPSPHPSMAHVRQDNFIAVSMKFWRFLRDAFAGFNSDLLDPAFSSRRTS